MEQPTEKPSYDDLSASVQVTIERFKQPEFAANELASVRSKLEAKANAAMSKATTSEEMAAIQRRSFDEYAIWDALYWQCWPHRTTPFQLAWIAAPFAAANAKDSEPLDRAKSLLILAEKRLEHWKNPPPKPRTEFTISEALERINERARGSKLREWKTARPLRKFLMEHREGMAGESFNEFWAKAKDSPEISSYDLMGIWELREKKEKAKQEKAATGKRQRSRNRGRK